MKITLAKTLKQKPDFSKLGFGKHFTDHMLYMEYANGEWSEVEIKPFVLGFRPASGCSIRAGNFGGTEKPIRRFRQITMFRPKDKFLL